jgi:two-component system, NtrC family, sensor kinase
MADDRLNDTPLAATGQGATPTKMASRAIGTLRLLLSGTILLPALLGVVTAYFSYDDNLKQAESSMSEAVAIVEQNTIKVLDTHLLVAARISDLIANMTDEQIAAQERTLHDKLAQQIANLPEVAAAWVIDANGHEIVSARVYPVNRATDQSGRDDFRVFRDSNAQTFIRALRARSLDGGDVQPYFTVSLRRTGPGGRFDGAIVVAVSGAYFASFYDALLGASAHYTASILKDDGTVLMQYPNIGDSSSTPLADPLLATAIAEKERGGVIRSGTPFDDSGRVIAFKRVANYPVYVAIERAQAAILWEWLWSVSGYVIVGVPAAIALVVLSALALRRTRREQMALAQARDAIASHAAAEAQLQQAQRLEAVGLLTAGIAHDFNNVLTVVTGNIELLQGSFDTLDPRRQHYLSAAIKACGRAATLTKRLLGFARREPGDPRAVNANEIVANTLELPWQAGDDIAREFWLSSDLWPVYVDPDQLATALLNLALNARDAMERGGKLTVKTVNLRAGSPEAGMTGEHIGIFVSDTGRGIPKEIRDKVFDPFFTTKGPDKGTGLGLPQVYGFITRSGGCCAIDSEPGHGTTVKLYLPRYLGEKPNKGNGATDMPGREDASSPVIVQTTADL